MKRKIAITAVQRTMLVSALMAYGLPQTAAWLNAEFEAADPANDGPEIAILSVDEPGYGHGV